MCFGSHCPYEEIGGPNAGECTLSMTELKEKCPADPPSIYAKLVDENNRLYDLAQRIGDLVGPYLPRHVDEELSRLINDAQLSGQYRTRVQELEEELKALKDTPF